MAISLRKTGLILAGLAVAGGLAYWTFRPQPVAVDLATIDRGTLEVTVSDDGQTRITDIYTVSAPVAGTVQRTPGRVGDKVVARETVVAVVRPATPALLDTRSRREAQAALAAANAAVRLADAQYREAETELELVRAEAGRIEELGRLNIVSDRSQQEARAAVTRAEARLASAAASTEMRRRERESAQARLEGPEADGSNGDDDCCITVKAPVDGEILTIHHESEAVVAAGTVLVEIGDPAELEVVAELLSADAVRIPPQADARIEGWGGPPLEARVRRVEPTGFTKVSALGIEEQRVRTIIDLVAPPEDRPGLGHGYRVTARITVERHEDALLVPLGALFRQGADWAVFVAGDDAVARLRTVELGARDARNSVVVSGLDEGETVVMHPSDRVAEGTALTQR
jgi:HlyD family secretion protein